MTPEEKKGRGVVVITIEDELLINIGEDIEILVTKKLHHGHKLMLSILAPKDLKIKRSNYREKM